MVKILEIHNFKSIKDLTLQCKRVNVFIGKPNTGKSNILETLGLLSWSRYFQYGGLRRFIRFEAVGNIFYDEHLSDDITIKADNLNFRLGFKNGTFLGDLTAAGDLVARFSGNHDDLNTLTAGDLRPVGIFKFYKFEVQKQFPDSETDFLLPPSGANLASMLLTHKDLRANANQILTEYNLRLGIRPQEHRLEVIKQFEDVIVSYPYSLLSDTFQRLIFHRVAILSNKQSVLVFEEPEAHAFPYYTKYLAETVGLDQENQYFMSTHNPYFLGPLMQKTPASELAIYVAYFKDYQTGVRLLTPEEMKEILDIDVFANLDRFAEPA